MRKPLWTQSEDLDSETVRAIAGPSKLSMATPRNRYLWPVTRSIAYQFFNNPRMLALKPPTAALMVAMKKERLNALVRFASVALSASMAPQEDAYIASESPDTTAVPTNSGRFVPTRANKTRVKLAITPPMTTNRFLP